MVRNFDSDYVNYLTLKTLEFIVFLVTFYF